MGRYTRSRPVPPARPTPKAQTAILLDAYSPGDIQRLKIQQELLGNVHWHRYAEMTGQRAKVMDGIKAALAGAAIGPYSFKSLQRAVKYRWCLNPLSPAGSLTDPGGRFNIGKIDPARYPMAPALYLAADKNTATQELFNMDMSDRHGLSAQDLALTRSDSITIVDVAGCLDTILDLNQPERLKPFVDIIKKTSFRRQL